MRLCSDIWHIPKDLQRCVALAKMNLTCKLLLKSTQQARGVVQWENTCTVWGRRFQVQLPAPQKTKQNTSLTFPSVHGYRKHLLKTYHRHRANICPAFPQRHQLPFIIYFELRVPFFSLSSTTCGFRNNVTFPVYSNTFVTFSLKFLGWPDGSTSKGTCCHA